MQHRTIEDYLGIPYKIRGEEGEGLDCYELVRLVSREIYGNLLPSYREVYAGNPYATNENTLETVLSDGLWESVAQRRVGREAAGDILEGDMIVFHFRQVYTHTALVVDAKRKLFIHVPMDGSVCIERFDREPWNRRIVGVFRWLGPKTENA